MQTRSVRMCGTRKRWGVIPDTRCPTCRWHGKRGASQATIRSRCTRASHSTHAFVHGRSSRVIPSKHAFRGGTSSERCRGSRRSRDIVEVVVHVATVVEVVVLATVVEVVVHVRFGEVLDESNIFGATVVVHGRRGTCRSGLGVDVHRKRSGTRGLRRR